MKLPLRHLILASVLLCLLAGSIVLGLSLFARGPYRGSHDPIARTHTITIFPVAVVETSPKIFIYGGFHAIPSNCVHSLKPVLELLKQVDCIYLEHGNSLLRDLAYAGSSDKRYRGLNPSRQRRLRELRSVVVLDGDRTLGEVLPSDLLSKLTRAAVGSGLPEDFVQNDRRAIWTYCFGHFPKHSTQSVYVGDLLREKARAANIAVYDLESIDSYVNVFATLTEEQQIDLLRCCLRSRRKGLDLGTSNYDKILKEFLEVYMDSERPTPQWKTEFFRRLLADRNQAMFERIAAQIGKRSCLVIVGAAHVGGEDGLIKYFRRAGYVVRLIREGETESVCR